MYEDEILQDTRKLSLEVHFKSNELYSRRLPIVCRW